MMYYQELGLEVPFGSGLVTLAGTRNYWVAPGELLKPPFAYR
jgi:hypothetical protein